MTRTAYLFPGQGSQTVGMGRSLAENFAASRAVFDEVDDALGEKLSELIWEGPEERLRLTKNAQPALMAVSLAAIRALKEKGRDPAEEAEFMAGHSLGEYSALAAAESLALADAARLLRLRGEAMQSAVPAGKGAMAAILGLDWNAVREIAAAAEKTTNAVCEAANDNAPGQIVLSGESAAIQNAIERAKEKGAKRAIPLNVSAPFHCRLMTPAADAMKDAIGGVKMSPPRVPIVSNVLAKETRSVEEMRDLLLRQISAPVRWRESVAFMAARGVSRFVEVGAGRVLSALARRIVKDAEIHAIGDAEELEKFCV